MQNSQSSLSSLFNLLCHILTFLRASSSAFLLASSSSLLASSRARAFASTACLCSSSLLSLSSSSSLFLLASSSACKKYVKYVKRVQGTVTVKSRQCAANKCNPFARTTALQESCDMTTWRTHFESHFYLEC